jgi:hypothetical protein
MIRNWEALASQNCEDGSKTMGHSSQTIGLECELFKRWNAISLDVWECSWSLSMALRSSKAMGMQQDHGMMVKWGLSAVRGRFWVVLYIKDATTQRSEEGSWGDEHLRDTSHCLAGLEGNFCDGAGVNMCHTGGTRQGWICVTLVAPGRGEYVSHWWH